MKKSAFSLIELSIVLIIIGILIAGVMQGGNLVAMARLTSARSFTAKSPVPNIDGLIAWYETSTKSALKESEAYDNAKTTEWRDISPSSIVTKKNTLTKTAGSDVLYKAAGINKTPSLQFSGSGKISLASFYQGNSAQTTLFIVFRPTSGGSLRSILLDSFVGQNICSFGIKSNAANITAGINSSDATASFLSGSNYIVAAYFNGPSSGAYVNNASSFSPVNTDPGSNALTGLTIGSNQNGANAFTGMISEVIIYNRPLKLQERKDVMNYLSKKYKIAVMGL